jgi:transposase
MVRPPTPEAEDERRICRERAELIEERIRHVNRIKGLLFSQGVRDYEPLRRDRRKRLEALRTGDGRALGSHLKAQIERELDRLELLLKQIKAVEGARDSLLCQLAESQSHSQEAPMSQEAPAADQANPSPVARLMRLNGIGSELAASLWTEGLSRAFANRRQAGSYPGLTPTPWRSGTIEREQGVSKSGNQRLRTKMLELAWLGPIHQPQSALARWYRQRLAGMRGKAARKRLTVALARKLFVALWKLTSAGVAIEGAVLKASV